MEYSSEIQKELVECILRCEAARAPSDFSRTYQTAVDLMSQTLSNMEDGASLRFLIGAFEDLKSRKRAHWILQHLSWMLFEKAPYVDKRNQRLAFHLFALPFVIQLSEAPCNNDALFEGPGLGATGILNELRGSGVLLEGDEVRGFSALMTASDLALFGPMNLSSSFREAESGQEVLLQPYPWLQEGEPDMRRVSLVFLPMAILSAPSSFCPAVARANKHRSKEMGLLMRKSLENIGLEPELVESLPPQRISNLLMSAQSAGETEIKCLLKQARAQLGIISAGVRYPSPGYFELFGQDEQGELFILSPPKVHLEPKASVSQVVKDCLQELGLGWAGQKVPLSRTGYLH